MSDWQADDTAVFDRHETVTKPHLRICGKDRDGRVGLYITAEAFRRLGQPKYVQIMFRKSNGLFQIRLEPTERTATSRPIRGSSAGRTKYQMGGAASMVKRHSFPKGYYMLDDNNIFTWRFN